jgi:hypothetical protein
VLLGSVVVCISEQCSRHGSGHSVCRAVVCMSAQCSSRHCSARQLAAAAASRSDACLLTDTANTRLYSILYNTCNSGQLQACTERDTKLLHIGYSSNTAVT